MKILDSSEIIAHAVANIGKKAVYISNNLNLSDDKDDEIWIFVLKSLEKIYGKNELYNNMMHILIDSGLFFFDTEEEQIKFYKTFEQPLTNNSEIYACTYDEYGKPLIENA